MPYIPKFRHLFKIMFRVRDIQGAEGLWFEGLYLSETGDDEGALLAFSHARLLDRTFAGAYYNYAALTEKKNGPTAQTQKAWEEYLAVAEIDTRQSREVVDKVKAHVADLASQLAARSVNRPSPAAAMILIGSGLITLAATPLPSQTYGLILSDMNVLANALRYAYIDTAYLTTLENLDDQLLPNTVLPRQSVNDQGGALIMLPNVGIPFRLTIGPNWMGPYISLSSQRILDPDNGDYDPGSPWDLYGNAPIYFYSPLGLVEPKTGNLSLRYYGDAFDSYTLVSHGANGRYDGTPDGQLGGDDIAVSIPDFVITSRVISSAKITPVETKGISGVLLTIRGYQLGANTGSAMVLLDGVDAPGVVRSWGNNRIEWELPEAPAPGTTVAVRLSTGSMALQSLEVILDLPALSVSNWEIYY